MLQCNNTSKRRSMLKFDALVRRRVFYEGSDGQPSRIPEGRCLVEAYQGFVSLTWVEEVGPRTAVLNAAAFESALETGAILITDASQLRPCPSRRERIPKVDRF